MPAKILDGKKLSEQILEELKKQAEELKQKKIVPCLAAVIVGSRPDSVLYVQKKQEACARIGIESRKISLQENVPEKELLEEIEKLNEDESVHGILVQLPLPKQIFQEKILDAISPAKDVDGFNSQNIGKLAQGIEELASCTAKGIIKLVESTGTKIEGKNVCIINDSIVVGKPLALMFLKRNATVNVCNKFTKNLAEFAKKADILVSAVGKKIVSKEMIKKGAIVIDAGICVAEAEEKKVSAEQFAKKKISGDVDFGEAKKSLHGLLQCPEESGQ